MKSVLKKYKKDNNAMIGFTDLEKLPLNECISIDKEGKIKTTRLLNGEGDLSFRVTMEADSNWTLHSHDCEETILLYKGSLRDSLTKKILQRMQCLIIPKFTSHRIHALEDSIFYVEFKKPN